MPAKSTPAITPLGPDGQPLRPAAVYTRESELDQGQYSPELQRKGAAEVLARHGYYVVMVEHDSKEGDKVTRRGYQKIKKAVTDGLIEAVGVYKMSRWGRDAEERLRIGKEFDKLRVPVYDAQRGKADTPGLERIIFAGLDEQFLRDLSWTMVRAMPAAARDGKHLGPTPIGYKRVYPEGEVKGKRLCAELVPHPIYAPLVVEVFERFANGESAHAISRWLNTLPDRPNPKNENTGLWSGQLVTGMLRRRAYIGEIEWGKRQCGKYNYHEGGLIESGVDDVPPARHPAIIERALWDRVQARLEGKPAQKHITQRGTPAPLLSGFLRCAGCGGPTTPWRQSNRPEGNGRYRCSAHQQGLSSCGEPGVSMPVADAAVLREVARLEGAPWEPPALDRLMNRDPSKAERQRLTAELAAAERDLQANVIAFRTLGDLSENAVAAFRRDAQTIDARIKSLKTQIDALPSTSIHLEEVKSLQELLRRTSLADLIARAQANGDTVGLRKVLGGFIESATLVKRVASGPAGRTVWARAFVDWSPTVYLMLEEGLLTLGPEPVAPTLPSQKERGAERARRYRARKKAQQEEVVA